VLFGSQLSKEQEKTLSKFLFNNRDIFAWSANDMCGVNRDIIKHSLNVDATMRPRKQKLQKMSDDKSEGARNEVKTPKCWSNKRCDISRMVSQYRNGKKGQQEVENVC
jgi:hypothetical protein